MTIVRLYDKKKKEICKKYKMFCIHKGKTKAINVSFARGFELRYVFV